MSTSVLLPNLFVTLETPGGTRWIYDLPTEMTRSFESAVPSSVRSDGGIVEIVQDRSGASYNQGARLVADHPLGVITWTTKGSKRVVQYVLRDDTARSEAFPPVISPQEWEDRCAESGCDDDCVWCSVRYRLYSQITEQVEGEPRSFDFSGYVQIAGNGIDQHPEFTWETGPQGRVMPEHLHYLMPGTLGGVWEAVAKELAELPHVLSGGGIGNSIYTSGDGIRLTVRLPLDKPRERWIENRGPSGRARVKKIKKVDTTVDKHIELRPPRRINAETKAAAVRKLHLLIAECVQQVSEAHVVWCTSCDGKGYTIPDPKGGK